jgi:hypothetical protein
MRPRMSKLEIMTKIVSERQPMKIYKVKSYARCYVEFQDSDKHEVYRFIRENFHVDVDKLVSIK